MTNHLETECIFCKIVRGELPAERVFEDDAIIAFKDINPQAPVHILVIPKQHIRSIADMETQAELAGRMLVAGARLAREQELAGAGYRLAVNHGQYGTQAVEHVHLHILGGRQLSGSLG